MSDDQRTIWIAPGVYTPEQLSNMILGDEQLYAGERPEDAAKRFAGIPAAHTIDGLEAIRQQWAAAMEELAKAKERIAELEAPPRTPYGIELDEARARVKQLESNIDKYLTDYRRAEVKLRKALEGMLAYFDQPGRVHETWPDARVVCDDARLALGLLICVDGVWTDGKPLIEEADERNTSVALPEIAPPSDPSPCCVCGEPITSYDSYGVGKAISHRYHWECVRKEAATVSPDYEGDLAATRARVAEMDAANARLLDRIADLRNALEQHGDPYVILTAARAVLAEEWV